MKIKVKMSCGHWVKTKTVEKHHPFGGVYQSVPFVTCTKCLNQKALANDIIDGSLS